MVSRIMSVIKILLIFFTVLFQIQTYLGVISQSIGGGEL
jgi:hypothetical protein